MQRATYLFGILFPDSLCSNFSYCHWQSLVCMRVCMYVCIVPLVQIFHIAMNSGCTLSRNRRFLSTWSTYFLMSVFWVNVPFMSCVSLSSRISMFFLLYRYNLYYKKHSGKAEWFLSSGPRSELYFILCDRILKEDMSQFLPPSILNDECPPRRIPFFIKWKDFPAGISLLQLR